MDRESYDGYGNNGNYRTGEGDSRRQRGYGDREGYSSQEAYRSEGTPSSPRSYRTSVSGSQGGYGRSEGYVPQGAYGRSEGYAPQGGYGRSEGASSQGAYRRSEGYAPQGAYRRTEGNSSSQRSYSTDANDSQKMYRRDGKTAPSQRSYRAGDDVERQEKDKTVAKRTGFPWFNCSAKNRKLFQILGIEVVILGILLILFCIQYTNGKLNAIQVNELDENGLFINEGLSAITKEKYTTIALFGLDSRDVTHDTRDRSDSIIIVNINNETKEIKMVSVYRDTYFELANPSERTDGLCTKITHAYAYGGAQASVATLNKNLDLQISEYVTVNFASLAEVVDALGGVTLNVDEAERQSVNIWLPETASIAGRSYTPLYETGDVTLDGLQAVTYCRIRNIGNGDFDRAGRQREVLEAILQKAKGADLKTLNKILDSVLPNISTSLDKKEILTLMSGVLQYEIVDTQGFPYTYHMGSQYDETLGQNLYVNTPASLEYNVILLHRFLYDAKLASDMDYHAPATDEQGMPIATEATEAVAPEELYEPSSEVHRISEAIIQKTGVYEPEDKEFRGGFQ